MQTSVRQKSLESLIFFSTAALVALLDQVSKFWVLGHIPAQPEGMGLCLREPYALIAVPKLLAFIHTRNEGAAFSLFNTYPVVLTTVAGVMALGVLIWALLLPAGDRLTRLALGMIFGGAAGNIADRFLHDFQVVDFILVLVTFKGRFWPTFNVADIAICVGIGLFLIASWLIERRGAANAQSGGAASESAGAPESR